MSDYSDVFARAAEIAAQRYPVGCASAATLAGIVREAIAELRDSDGSPEGRDREDGRDAQHDSAVPERQSPKRQRS